MIANSAFLAGMLVLLLVFWLMGELAFLAPYKRGLVPQYLWVIVGAVVVLFLNLFACVYTITRAVFLKETGRKLAHVERQLQTPDAVVSDLSERLTREE